jgi:hypothetical protein
LEKTAMKSKIWFAGLGAICFGCSETKTNGGDTGIDLPYDPSVLAEYLKAIPAKELLEVSLPESFEGSRGFGDPAFFPGHAIEGADWINSAVGGTLSSIAHFSGTEPTIFDEVNGRFTWGPAEHPDSQEFGQMMLTIEKPSGSFFEYEYTLYRLLDADQATAVPIIWGGSNPVGGDLDTQMGILLWDMDANRDFGRDNAEAAEATNPGYTTALLARGRFVATYGHNAVESSEDASIVPVYAVFDHYQRDADADTIDLNFVYGRYQGEHELKFFDFLVDAHAEVPDQSNDALESMAVKMAYIDSGEGRAEAAISGGDLESAIEGTECWNSEILQHYWLLEQDGTELETSGATSNCGPATETGPMFDTSLEELDFPTKEDIDSEYVDLLECLGENGPSGCG